MTRSAKTSTCVALLWMSLQSTLGFTLQPLFVSKFPSFTATTRSTRPTAALMRLYANAENNNNNNKNNNKEKKTRKPNSNKRGAAADTTTTTTTTEGGANGAAEKLAGGDSNNLNWMEPSTTTPNTYDVKLQGSSFQIGALAQRLYEALKSRQLQANDEEKMTLKAVAMELAAHQATYLAVEQNGLELASVDESTEYGAVETIQLVPSVAPIVRQQPRQFTSWADAANEWSEGDNFDFLLRGVRARQRKLTTQDLLRSLDPDGSYREQAVKAGIEVPTDENELKAVSDEMYENDDEMMAQLPQPQSLADMAQDNIRRRESAPVPAVTAEEAFAGSQTSRGYRPLSAETLSSTSLMADDSADSNFAPAVMHVMDALVSHGCLVVDVTDGGVHMEKAVVLKDMWQAAADFFQQQDQAETMPQGMVTVAETGSSHAKVGYASYDNGNLQFLETRLERSSGMLLPEQAQSIMGVKGCEALQKAFGVVASAGKDIVRLTVAASSVEAGVLTGDSASKAALLLANELVDDSRSLPKGTDIEHAECAVSMSPHRLCRYSNNDDVHGDDKEKKTNDPTREVFGAHTDSSFVTAVPVAAVAGLEVYDEAGEQWYRPEKAVRKYWQKEQVAAGKDPEALTEATADGVELPWHSRYVVMIPGELLQLATRNEVPAAVHRVVATEGKASRLSAPILLRGRSGMTLDIGRYLGSTGGDPLLEECSGMTIEQIHDSMQAPPPQ
jgi:hypothetical protein